MTKRRRDINFYSDKSDSESEDYSSGTEDSDSSSRSASPDLLGDEELSKEASFLYREYLNIFSQYQDDDAPSDGEEYTVFCYDNATDPNEFSQKIDAFVFSNRNIKGIDELISGLGQEDSRYYIPDNNLEELLEKAFKDNNEEILDALYDELTAKEISSLSLEFIEKFENVYLASKYYKSKSEIYVENIAKKDFSISLDSFLEYLEEDDINDFLYDVLQVFNNDEKPSTDLIIDLIEILKYNYYQRGKAIDLGSSEAITRLFQIAVDSKEYNEKEVEEHQKALLEFSQAIADLDINDRAKDIFADVLDDLLKKDQFSSAIYCYGIIKKLFPENFINNPKLVDALLSEKNFISAFEYMEQRAKYIEEFGVESDEKEKLDDDSTHFSYSVRRGRDYDILANLKKVKEYKLAFIAKAVGKSLQHSKEVTSLYYEKQKEKLGENTEIYKSLLQQWIPAMVRLSCEECEEDIMKERVDQLCEKFLNDKSLVLRHRFNVMVVHKYFTKKSYHERNEDAFVDDRGKIMEMAKELFDEDKEANANQFLVKFEEFLLQSKEHELLDRTTLKKQQQEFVDNANDLDLFANVRLLRRNAVNFIKKKVKSRVKIEKDENRGFIVKYLNIGEIPDIGFEQQIGFSDFVNYYSKNLEKGKSSSYEVIYSFLADLKTSFSINDSDIAHFMRNIINGDDAFYKSEEDKKSKIKFQPEEYEDLYENIAAITTLLFYVEAGRNSSAFVTHQMMLDLIIKDSMSFEESFKNRKMPMSVVGAVGMSRSDNNRFAELLPFGSQPLYGPNKGKSVSQVMKLEDKIVKKWLDKFHKGHDKPSKELCKIINSEVSKWYPSIDFKDLATSTSKTAKNKIDEELAMEEEIEIIPQNPIPDHVKTRLEEYAKFKKQKKQEKQKESEKYCVDLYEQEAPFVILSSVPRGDWDSLGSNPFILEQNFRNVREIDEHKRFFVINNHGNSHWDSSIKDSGKGVDNIKSSGKGLSCGAYTLLNIVKEHDSVKKSLIDSGIVAGDFFDSDVNSHSAEVVRGIIGNIIKKSRETLLAGVFSRNIDAALARISNSGTELESADIYYACISMGINIIDANSLRGDEVEESAFIEAICGNFSKSTSSDDYWQEFEDFSVFKKTTNPLITDDEVIKEIDEISKIIIDAKNPAAIVVNPLGAAAGAGSGRYTSS